MIEKHTSPEILFQKCQRRKGLKPLTESLRLAHLCRPKKDDIFAKNTHSQISVWKNTCNAELLRF